ncbi:hypothetical protein GTA08_BOTSDO13212 [Botryosphaeria dothidea]|uniref:Uncharacterized protein n=1 Tax=Botryosphaeria dothidea TaxID=55169 RepID=A0A8H4J573_9PEZI|nr:hypothetical protein GTA08_BOTSDO13212 [Botryosphaeria dothidea]
MSNFPEPPAGSDPTIEEELRSAMAAMGLSPTKRPPSPQRTQVPSPPLHSDSIFDWNRVPGEIRNLIYDRALQHPSGSVNVDVPDGNLVPNLLRINKKTFSEGLPILYQQNTFYFPHTRALWMFLTRCSPRVLLLLQSVIVDFHGTMFTEQAFRLLARASNLQSVVIREIPGAGDFGSRDTSAVSFCYAVRHWIRRLGHSNRERRDALCRILRIDIGRVSPGLPFWTKQVAEDMFGLELMCNLSMILV